MNINFSYKLVFDIFYIRLINYVHETRYLKFKLKVIYNKSFH